jgi:hypothetical protein
MLLTALETALPMAENSHQNSQEKETDPSCETRSPKKTEGSMPSLLGACASAVPMRDKQHI